jgi:hypothetical protein
VVSTESFEELIGSGPVSFDKWSARHAAELALVAARIGGPAPSHKQAHDEEDEDATSERSLDSNKVLQQHPSKVGVDTHVDLIKLRETCAASFGNPCPQCHVPFGVTRMCYACCECGVMACRKCVRPFESALVECTQV